MVAVTAALVVTSCSATSDEGHDGIRVVATTTILGDVVAHIVGDAATVEVLMPAGTDPHEFRPSSRQIAAIANADLVVMNGLGLEEGLEPALESAESDGVPVLRVAPLADPLAFDDDHDEDGGHDHEAYDPHVWLDPLRVADMVDAIEASLTALEPTTEWAERATAYRDLLAQTHRTITEMLLVIPAERRSLVTNHEALGYYADRYGFRIVGVVIPGASSVAQPSSADIAGLVETMRVEGVDVIFAETSLPTDLAKAVAAELGSDVDVVELHTGSLGPPGTPAEDLVGMLIENTRLIVEALQ